MAGPKIRKLPSAAEGNILQTTGKSGQEILEFYT